MLSICLLTVSPRPDNNFIREKQYSINRWQCGHAAVNEAAVSPRSMTAQQTAINIFFRTKYCHEKK
jgi:hypothetical protein